MGVLPLQFKAGDTPASLGLTGTEVFSLLGIGGITARGALHVAAQAADGATTSFTVTVRIDTPEELVAFRHGGILPYVVRKLVG